ncbi:MAG: twin-arginine translocase subunit TatC [Gemmataceae bacterium]
MLFGDVDKYNYPEDIFDQSRMSFGDHLDELRTRLRKALLGPFIFTILGLLLDGVGAMTNHPMIGMGRPMMAVITDPVTTMVRDFYARRNELLKDRLKNMEPSDQDTLLATKAKFDKYGFSSLSSTERGILFGAWEEMPVELAIKDFTPVFGEPKNPEIEFIQTKMRVYPAYINYLSNRGETLNEKKNYLTALSAQEGMVVYFKVTLLCAVVLSCPWSFYHIWAFIAAGLYPHERAYVNKFLPSSVVLFLSGVMLCQFIVLPGTVKALLGFNEYIDVDPDLRLNEWLSFAIMMPVVFGISFQTPLVMFVLNRLRIFTAAAYLSKWRIAMFVLAVFSAIITPSPDAVTMLYLFVPMYGLYLLGVGVCWFFPPAAREEDSETDASEVAV